MTTLVQIGPTTWDQHTGALTPSGGTSVREERNADGSVKLYPQAKRDESAGTIVTTKLVTSQRVANQLNILASSLIDSRVSVALPGGVVLAGIRVQEVQIRQEKKRYRAGEDILVTATWVFGPRESDDGDPKELYVTTKVETCTKWGKWILREDLIATAYVDTWGGSMGSASFVQVVDTTDDDAAPLDVCGQWVRIQIPTGDDLVRPEGFVVDWHGRIKTRDVGTDNGRITAVFSALDLRDEFDTYLLNWYENDDSGVIDPGEIPPFNFGSRGEGNGSDGGDRSTVGVGPDGVFVHDRNQAAGVPWRGNHIVDSLLAALEDQMPGGPVFTLGGQRAALDNFHPCDLDGRSLGEQLAQVISQGLGYRLSVETDGSVTVDVSSPLRTLLTVGAWVIPANDRQTTIDLSDDDTLQGWSLGEDHGYVRDIVLMQLGRPWHTTSMGISGFDDQQLRKDYTGAEATAWDAADVTKRNSTLSHVYRRFRLHSAWSGGGYAASTNKPALHRETAIDDIHGTDGETGEFSVQVGDGFLARAIKLTKALPFTQGGQDWSNPAYATLDPRDPLEKPFVCIITDPGLGTEKWDRLDMEVTVDTEVPVVTLGRDADDAAFIRKALAAGKHLVVTIGYRLPLPWRVSWRRVSETRLDELTETYDDAQDAADAAPGDAGLAAAAAAAHADLVSASAQTAQTTARPRSVLYQRPDIEYRYMDDQTVVGLNARAPVFAAAGLIGNKPTTPNQLLSLARLSHEKSFFDLTWTKAGFDLTVATEPGALITEATLPWGGDAGTANTLDAIIAHRARTLDRTHPSTSWSCMRRVADVLISPDPVPRPPGVNAKDLAALAYKR